MAQVVGKKNVRKLKGGRIERRDVVHRQYESHHGIKGIYKRTLHLGVEYSLYANMGY